HSSELPSLGDYLAVLRRRIWVIVALIVLFTGLGYVVAARKPVVYGTTAQVLLDTNSVANSLLGINSSASAAQPDRYAVTQAQLARVPQVTRQAAHVVGHGMTSSGVLAATTVTAAADADLLTFAARDGNPARAVRLANAYAKAYADYRTSI